MSVLNQYHKLPLLAPDSALDVGRMSVAVKRSANLLSWWGDPLCNIAPGADNDSPSMSYDTAVTTAKERQLLAVLCQGTRNKPYSFLYGFLEYAKPSTLTGWVHLHVAPGVLWPADDLQNFVVDSFPMKSGFTSEEHTILNQEVYRLTQPKEDYTAWLTVERSSSGVTGSVELLCCGLQWAAIE